MNETETEQPVIVRLKVSRQPGPVWGIESHSPHQAASIPQRAANLLAMASILARKECSGCQVVTEITDEHAPTAVYGSPAEIVEVIDGALGGATEDEALFSADFCPEDYLRELGLL